MVNWSWFLADSNVCLSLHAILSHYLQGGLSSSRSVAPLSSNRWDGYTDGHNICTDWSNWCAARIAQGSEKKLSRRIWKRIFYGAREFVCKELEERIDVREKNRWIFFKKYIIFFKYLTEKRTEGHNSIGSESSIFFKSLADQRKCVWQKWFIFYLNWIVKIKQD